MLGICGIAILSILSLLLWLFLDERKRDERRKQLAREEELKRIEENRIKECSLSIRWIASELGYIARKVIPRSELSEMIDAGLAAEDIETEIVDRIIAFDAVQIGVHRGTDFPVKLAQDFRDRHVYVVGKSGSGKTTLLRQLIIQDMEGGNGLAVIAPEQEMITEELLPFVPDHRIDDVVYFNPVDEVSPVSINPLHLDVSEDAHRRAEENMTIFSRLLGNDGTPRINEILRQAFHALLQVKGTTLLDIPKLLDRENPHYRNYIVEQIPKDSACANFWKRTYLQFPQNAHIPIVYRLGRFTQPRYVRNVLCQAEPSIDFRTIMDTGKIALFNLSDGIIGEQSSQLLGQLIVSKFQTAAIGRADTSKEDRRRFYLYVDEFQAFTPTASTSYEKILSRARKYRLALVLAHQQTGQLSGDLLREILGNVSTVVCFTLSSSDARRLAPELISASGTEVTRTSPESLVALRVGQAYTKIGTSAFPMTTRLVQNPPSFTTRNIVVERSQKCFGVKAGAFQTISKRESGSDSFFDTTDPRRVF